MAPEELAEVFLAGWTAIPSRNEPAGNALAIALEAMERKCREIARGQK